jgi:integrase
LREGELLGLTWDDVDLGRSVLRIRRQLRRVNGSNSAKVFVLQTTKTKAGERVLVLDADLVAVMREHLRNQTEEVSCLASSGRTT